MLAITGANGHLGQRLLQALPPQPLRVLVRSARAAAQIEALCRARDVEPRVVDYADADALGRALDGCDRLVHLVGIIRESAAASYADAHERVCMALANAAARARLARIVHLSILGAATDAANRCLASKGRAEALLLAGAVPVSVLRVPMVLGEHDYASSALRRRAQRPLNLLLRAASLEQPIYAGDVVEAVRVLAAHAGRGSDIWQLAGPESLCRAALTRRAAAVLGRHTRVVSLPVGWGMAMAGLLERVVADPPITRAMLGVLDHDDRIDPAPAATALGLTLTPLDDMLRRCMAAPDGAAGGPR